MIRSSLVARWALGLVVLLAGSASLPAVDLYVTGDDLTTNKYIFGKIDSATLVYSQLNSDIGGGFNSTTGLAWNSVIGKFNTLRDDGSFSTITTTGTVGSVIATGLSNGTLAYNSASSTMYSVNPLALNTVNPATGAQSNIGSPGVSSVYGSAFVNGTMYGTTRKFDGVTFDSRYGSFNLSTGAFTAITASSDSTYSGMALAYDGTTLFGLTKGLSLYTLNPTTGAYTGLGTVTGISNALFYAVSVPVAVPEPSTYALAAIATGVMAAIARRRKARRA